MCARRVASETAIQQVGKDASILDLRNDMKIITCPECGRIVKVKQNRFGDKIYARHKMAVLPELMKRWFTGKDNERDMAQEEVLGDRNPLAFPINEIDCPNSGQPL